MQVDRLWSRGAGGTAGPRGRGPSGAQGWGLWGACISEATAARQGQGDPVPPGWGPNCPSPGYGWILGHSQDILLSVCIPQNHEERRFATQAQAEGGTAFVACGVDSAREALSWGCWPGDSQGDPARAANPALWALGPSDGVARPGAESWARHPHQGGEGCPSGYPGPHRNHHRGQGHGGWQSLGPGPSLQRPLDPPGRDSRRACPAAAREAGGFQPHWEAPQVERFLGVFFRLFFP